MGGSLGRAFAAFCAAIAFGASTLGCAWAQDLPRAFSSIDERGVDLTSGQLVLSETPISVGPANGGLGREFFNAGSRDPMSGTINTSVSGSTTTYTISLGGSSSIFTKTGLGDYVAGPNAQGMSLTYDGGTIYTLTLLDGTQATFYSTDVALAPVVANLAMVREIRRPDGETLSYTYVACGTGCKRLQAVTSNLGYMIKYQYVADNGAIGSSTLMSVKAINLAYDYCNPSASSCSTTYNWMSATLAGMTSGTGSYTTTDAMNRDTTYTLVNGRITKIVRPSGATYDYEYTDDRVTKATTPSGSWGYAYTGSGNASVTTVTDPNSNARSVTYDAATGVVSASTDASGTITFTNDSVTGANTRATSPLQGYVNYRYDNRGNLDQVTRASSTVGTPASIVTATGYRTNCIPVIATVSALNCNKPLTSTDAAGRVTNYIYSALNGQLLVETGPAGSNGKRPQTRYTYDIFNVTVKTSTGGSQQLSLPVSRLVATSQCVASDGVDPIEGYGPADCEGTDDEVRTTYAYDNPNRQLSSVSVKAGGGSVLAKTVYTYNRFGDIESIDGPLAGSSDVAHRRYNDNRELIGAIDADPDGEDSGRQAPAARYNYKTNGQLESVDIGTVASSSDIGWAGFTTVQTQWVEYDSAYRLAKETLKVGADTRAITQYAYDAADRQTCVAQRMKLTSLPTSICSLNATVGDDGPDRLTKYAYDAADRLTTVTSAYLTADERAETTTYATAGNRERSVTDGNGNKTTYKLDGMGRVEYVYFPSAATTGQIDTSDYVFYTYNTVGLVGSVRRRDGSTDTLTYDPNGQITARTSPSTTAAYDNLGRRTSITANGAATISNTYDALGRIKTETGAMGTVSYIYDTTGGKPRRTVTWPGTSGLYVDYVYDYGGALSEVREKGATSGAGLLAKYSYDDLGRRVGLASGNSNGVTATYGYDATWPLDQLKSFSLNLSGTANDQSVQLTYNPAGQVKTRTSNDAYVWNDYTNINRAYLVDGKNRLTNSGGKYVKYSNKGHLQSVCGTDFETSCDNVFGYNVDGKLTSSALTSTVGSSTSTTNTTLTYDSLGRLYATTAGSVVTHFLYDGTHLIAEYASDDTTVLRRYVHGDTADEPLVWYEGSDLTDRRWFSSDNLGSVIAISDANGAIKTRPDASKMILTYDEYGMPGAANGGVRFQFTGQVWLPDVGVYHYKARQYSPYLGRFLQTDRTGYEDGQNWYAYVGNDPVNAIDPTGNLTLISNTSCAPYSDAGIGVSGGYCKTTYTYFGDSYSGGGGGGGGYGGGGGGGGVAPSAPRPSVRLTPQKRACNFADYTSQTLKAGALIAGTVVVVGAVAIAAAPAGAVAATTIVGAATVTGIGLTAASVVADGVADGYSAGFESGLGAAVDQGLGAAGTSAIGAFKANSIGLVKSALDFAAGPNCRAG